MDSAKILKKPIYTEKSLEKATSNIYTFEVARRARKEEIKKAVEDLFGVQVKKVRTASQKPKTKRVGKTRYEVKTKVGKKAVVWSSGKIDLWEVPEEKETRPSPKASAGKAKDKKEEKTRKEEKQKEKKEK